MHSSIRVFGPMVRGCPAILAIWIGAITAADDPEKPLLLRTAERKLQLSLERAEREHRERVVKAYAEHCDVLEKAKGQLIREKNLAAASAVDAALVEATRTLENERSQLTGEIAKIPAVISVEGEAFSLAPFRSGETVYTNRGYKWIDVPREFDGWAFTRAGGNTRRLVHVKVREPGYLLVVVEPSSTITTLAEWKPFGDFRVRYNDTAKTPNLFYARGWPRLLRNRGGEAVRGDRVHVLKAARSSL